MGMMVDGQWREDDGSWATGGRFVRRESQFRDSIVAAEGTGAEAPYTAAAGRYHLYVSLACPWAHRTLIVRKLKRLENAISLSVVDPLSGPGGWHFSDGPGCVPDPIGSAQFLHQVYARAQSDYTGRVTVPVLWDKGRGRIVNNESAEIIRMFNGAFNDIGDATVDLYPPLLRTEIDAVNADVYENINNGVYKCGFATSQDAYDEAFDALFAALGRIEARLDRQRYLCGAQLTEADWRLFTTLIRFDAVYVGHFKCSLRRIADYPNLSNYLRELYQVPGIGETCDFTHIKSHYYRSHVSINPTGIVPRGPAMALDTAHDRDRFAAASAAE
ncbi:MAG: glutathione S-transferase family protein [Alphaproteobacteria bacterium]|jgi:putative glutathione S-transferase|nr:glutathione S-transferase family protein [Alphaproteobacteria bacterium]